jgi:hypothetical protein
MCIGETNRVPLALELASRGLDTMTDEFTIESRTSDAIRIRHVRHSHRYIFTVQKLRGRRLLWAGPIMGNAKASLPAITLVGAARTFAEREARKAGLID